jgi:membrane protease YdiL (CAAX protease family)
MNRIDIAVSSGIVLAAILIYALPPYQQLAQWVFAGETTEYGGRLLRNLLVILFSAWLVCRPSFKKYFLPVPRDSSVMAWILLPVVYPGILYIFNRSVACIQPGLSTMLLLAYLVTAGLSEEWIFRGILQGYLRGRYPKRSAAIVCLWSASFFGIVHLMNLRFEHPIGVIPQVLGAFSIGLFLGILRIRGVSIWLLGLAHGLINVVGRDHCPRPGIPIPPATSIGFMDHVAASAIMLLVMLPLLLAFWMLSYRYRADGTMRPVS